MRFRTVSVTHRGGGLATLHFFKFYFKSSRSLLRAGVCHSGMSVVAEGAEGLGAHGAAVCATSEPDADFAGAPRAQKGKHPADAGESNNERGGRRK